MIITQSICKDIESLCPRLFQDRWLDGNRPEPELPMLYGSYFEYKCLGSGATDKLVTDLPRTMRGDRYIDHVRTDLQVEAFKKFVENNWNITATQLYLEADGRGGTIDIEIDKNAIADLKLTKDLETGYWSKEVDMIQMWHYGQLYEKNFGIKPKLYYLIFDYSSQLRSRLIELEITPEKHDEFEQRFKSAESLLLEQFLLKETTGEFSRIPSPVSCSRCKLECSVRLTNPIDYKKITI